MLSGMTETSRYEKLDGDHSAVTVCFTDPVLIFRAVLACCLQLCMQWLRGYKDSTLKAVSAAYIKLNLYRSTLKVQVPFRSEVVVSSHSLEDANCKRVEGRTRGSKVRWGGGENSVSVFVFNGLLSERSEWLNLESA